jgi:hypothetical protein
MHRILTQIQVENPDVCHSLGQTLIRPLSYLFGHSYQIDRDVNALPNPSTTRKVAVAALILLLSPLLWAAIGIGALLLSFSSSHKRAYKEVQTGIRVIWNNGIPEIRSRQVILRPIQAADLPIYQNLFNNAVAMQKFAGGVRDITPRFNKWLERWREHPFSALAVVDKESQRVIGHVVSDHGDYEGDLKKGWSEMAIVLEPTYWNSSFQNAALGIGIAGKKNIGTEVVRASVAYAHALRERHSPVPCDVTPEQRPQLEQILRDRPDLKVHRDAQGQMDWIYLPFTELKATGNKANIGGYKILERVFLGENKGVWRTHTPERNLFAIHLT